jgi:hypothetical protein
MADTDQKKIDRKRNFTEPEINVIQDEPHLSLHSLGVLCATPKADTILLMLIHTSNFFWFALDVENLSFKSEKFFSTSS